MLSSAMDSSGSGRLQLSQPRSQSQGPSLSQLSQSSLDDVLLCDQVRKHKILALITTLCYYEFTYNDRLFFFFLPF